MVTAGQEDAHALIEQLEGERDRLQNAVTKLRESNAILKAELEKEFDRDYKQAIEDNIPLIASYTARIERLEREIKDLKRGIQVIEVGEVLLATLEEPTSSNGAMEL